jgi:dephospho-CoA kinase
VIQVVIISGKQGSGKTTTMKELERLARGSGYGLVYTWNFADPLYKMHEYILNFMERMTGTKRVDKDGVLLQLLGTEWGRKQIDQNVWVNIMKRRIEELEAIDSDKARHLIIIGDCRFENELDFVPEALTVRLICDESVRKARAHAWRENTRHPSETGLDQFEIDGKFDLFIETDHEVSSPMHAATLIMSLLKRGSWVEKRTRTNKAASGVDVHP